MTNMEKGHPDPRKKKITRDGMTPITRMEGKHAQKTNDGSNKEFVDQLIDYEWPGQ